MMKRIFLVFILAATTGGAHASGWPWQDSDSTQENLDYCTGLVVGGLASDRMEGMSRTDLWLAWAYLIRTAGALNHDGSTADFTTGRDQFSDTLDASAQLANLDNADGSCGFGRSGHQITGW